MDTTTKPDSFVGFWENVTSEKHLLLGQWDHTFPTLENWTEIRHAWFDHYLLQRGPGPLLPPILSQSDDGAWHARDDRANLTELIFYPNADGTLGSEAVASSLELMDYPRGSVSGPFERTMSAAIEAGTQPPAQLMFITEPLESPLHIVGTPHVRLSASTGATSTHWAARLVEISPDDPVPNDVPFTRGFFDTRHRTGLDDPRDLAPGENYALTIPLFPADQVIESGHRLALVLSNSDDFIQQDSTAAKSTVALGESGTRLFIEIDSSE